MKDVYETKATKDKERYQRQKEEFHETGRFTPVAIFSSAGDPAAPDPTDENGGVGNESVDVPSFG